MASAREGLRRAALSALVVLLTVLGAATPVVAQTPAVNPAFTGQSMWIWQLARTEGGDLAKIAARARQYGISAVYLKSADGGTPWPQFSAPTVATLHAAGLRVCGWQFVYGVRPVAEAAAASAAVRAGADCLIIDAESSYEGRYTAARQYLRSLRSRIGPAYPLGLTSFPYIDFHPAFPYSVFLGAGGAQVNMPQVYWKDIGDPVDRSMGRTWKLNRVYGRPLHPIGQLYQAPSATEVLRFRTLASGYGAIGTSWWDWQEAPLRLWSVLAQPALAPAAATLADPGWPVLARRAKGDLVVQAQRLLRLGGRRVRANGIYGAQTIAAVKRLQLSKGLPPTGVTDASAWQALLGLPITQVPPPTPVAAPTTPSPGGSLATGAHAGADGTPLSARLPAVRNELSGKR